MTRARCSPCASPAILDPESAEKRPITCPGLQDGPYARLTIRPAVRPMSRPTSTPLPAWLRAHQGRGRVAFTLAEFERSSGSSRVAAQSALRRAKESGRIVSPCRGFFVIVPPEYAAIGSPPAAWFVDDLMRHLGVAYHVGLLSAAALHGAAHQQPQTFQVMTSRTVAPIAAGKVRIDCFRKRHVERAITVRLNTPTGTMCVASAADTVFDLVRHAESCGQLDNVATVLFELAEHLNVRELAAAASRAHVTEVQRAGHLFELVERGTHAAALSHWLDERRVPYALLRPGASTRRAVRNKRWHLVVNARVDPDL